ncbi:coiled-coil domain-containing protein 55-domain containing protein [Massariosphaeria phaeospora]|uniref:Coiled-coil domain-containing protein 55-domain containing protein n=1 Tax=Massariosphaeria phaeospora TaxID=100035 RepID=A0A7C8MK57_9PLEO|nr:coiled-coil domain-containing protein 55-domain containing protein [Massariosphaeria phaeospora]
MAFRFSLDAKKSNLTTNPRKRKALLDDGSDEEKPNKRPTNTQDIGELNFEDITSPSESNPVITTPPKSKARPKQDDPSRTMNSASLQEAEKRIKEALDIDSAIYDYDAAYDAIHARAAAKEAAKREEALERRPKYMDNLLISASVRKKDQLRAQDKLLKREREAEGDAFADKEMFVTSAYKAQQEEARKAEEEERIREAKEGSRKSDGLQAFHRKMLLEEERRHQEDMEAAAELAKTRTLPVEQPKLKSDRELAAEAAKSEGKAIILNEEGEITDRRQLLSAGLNRPAPAPVPVPRPAPKPKADAAVEDKAGKSIKPEDKISSAKERFLQRKREKEGK